MRLFLSALLVLLTSPAIAQVVTVDVTIKAVKVESRGLEVTYETNLGDKTAELDVSRKATITINDNEGSLEELKSGYVAKVEYHKELGVITKITATAISYEEATLKALKAMEGEWKCIASEENGKSRASFVEQENRRLTIERNSLTMATGDGSRSWVGKFEIDASNGHFDWVGKSDNQLVEWIGIYELDGDSLKLCFIFQKDDKAKRPTEFKSLPPAEPGLAHALYTFKRETQK